MSRFRWLVVMFGLALCAFGIAARKPASAQIFGFPIFARARENARRSSCQSNLKQLSLGVLQYTQDYDEWMPPARKWNDVLQPYVKSTQILNCPSASKFGYAMNSKLSIKTADKIEAPWATDLFYETPQLQANAFGMGETIANRHLGGANYAYADGHVKWLAGNKKAYFNLKAPRDSSVGN